MNSPKISSHVVLSCSHSGNPRHANSGCNRRACARIRLAAFTRCSGSMCAFSLSKARGNSSCSTTPRNLSLERSVKSPSSTCMEQAKRGSVTLREYGNIHYIKLILRWRIQNEDPANEMLKHPPGAAANILEGKKVQARCCNLSFINNHILRDRVDAFNQRRSTDQISKLSFVKQFDVQMSKGCGTRP